MARFVDGPAAGVSLQLRRAPIMLRVVHAPCGKWDALDQPTDAAAPDETIYVYRIASRPMSFHLYVRGKSRGAGGFYQDADYVLWPDQPGESVRSNKAWSQWCDDHRQAVLDAIADLGVKVAQ